MSISTIDAQTLFNKAVGNRKKWGKQDLMTLGLAIAEECGELAQAILQAKHEGGDERRVFDEAIDLGALCLQVMEHWGKEE